MYDRLEVVQKIHPELISPSIDVLEDYGLSRSFRRGSNSEAINRGVDRKDRWRSVERIGTRKVRL